MLRPQPFLTDDNLGDMPPQFRSAFVCQPLHRPDPCKILIWAVERAGSGGSFWSGPQWHMAMQRAARPGTVFADLRGDGRSLRATWHPERQVVVLSLWRSNVCIGTFRLAADEVPDLIAMLRNGLDESYDVARERVERLERPYRAG